MKQEKPSANAASEFSRQKSSCLPSIVKFMLGPGHCLKATQKSTNDAFTVTGVVNTRLFDIMAPASSNAFLTLLHNVGFWTWQVNVTLNMFVALPLVPL